MSTVTEQPRSDYPRPQFVRQQWMNLNGEWEFDYDDARVGDQAKWYAAGHEFSKSIQVPFCFQSKLSGIAETAFHDVVWYRKKLNFTAPLSRQRTLLHFGAVDYLSWVWINGQLVKMHEGGHTPFQVDITDSLVTGENTIVVKAQDFSRDLRLPRGKQFWKEQSESIWYTGTTGIWQTVWLETVSEAYLDKVKFLPNLDTREIHIRSFIKGDISGNNVKLKINISFNGAAVVEDVYRVYHPEEARSISIVGLNEHNMNRNWSPEHPNLYDVQFTLFVNDVPVDQVDSYFGMRKVSIENGKLNLNNRPYYMKLVLDQGYFPEGILTPPSDEAIKHDVELTKAMGFNGARKHQKVEDPRWLYWCDKLGLLVWSEMANAYDYSAEYVRRFTQEWQEIIDRDYNHPSIVAWVPLNESWGVPDIQINGFQQQHALALYHLTKSLDLSRPVISNDGWEHMKSDLCTIHDYEWRQEVLEERYSTAEKALQAMPANIRIHVGGSKYEGEPILVTEFGGIAFKKSDWEGWGYSGAVDELDFLKRLNAVVNPMLTSPVVQGFCYTQLTDVEQEINGLLTYDRVPKVDVAIIKQINEGNWKPPVRVTSSSI